MLLLGAPLVASLICAVRIGAQSLPEPPKPVPATRLQPRVQTTAPPQQTSTAPKTDGQPKEIGTMAPIDDATWQGMQSKSWRPNVGCPTRDQLALLTIPFIDFADTPQTGKMIVAKSVASDVIKVFAELRALRFPIASMRLVDEFGGNDAASMKANNTSAFNCRPVTGGTRLSEHSYGTAIDLNPIQNPYVTGSRILPIEGAVFAPLKARFKQQPGKIIRGDAVVEAFARIGWKWGGSWSSPKDYQHFSKSGR